MPEKLLTFVKNSLLGTTAIVLTLFYPAFAFADTAATCTPPSINEAGVHVPTGADASTYHYDCDLQLWVNDHYTFNPYTTVTTPRDARVYTYNTATGLWDVPVWVFSAAKGIYQLQTQAVTQPPAGATTVGGPVAKEVAPAPSTPTTGDSGGSAVDSTVNANLNSTNSTTAQVQNSITSNATSGNAAVLGNTTGGNALTGDAQTIATVMNMLQSSSTGFSPGGNALTFTANINGDVNGDLLLDPALIGAIQPASSLAAADNLTINTANNTDQSITNNIDLGAKSGDATVSKNTTAGSATSGNADVVANVVNILNSAVSSGQSFLGVININGNLNGDILLPPNFIDQLLAANVPTVNISTGLTANVDTTNNTSQTIANNVTTNATSGNASVDKNTTAGGATTGSASTNITAFNLTGSNIVGSNDLLVFVNVLGTWYGMIFNAPGATSANLGGGITANAVLNAQAQNNLNQSITNNINLAAQSGDATVSKNTTAGGATSGDARAAANILNMANSSISLANWFGILFINVFGSWNGSFGIDTAAGNPPVIPSVPSIPQPAVSGGNGSGGGGQERALFRFVAIHPHSTPASTFSPLSNSSGATDQSHTNGQVLAASATKPLLLQTAATPQSSSSAHRASFLLPALGTTLGIAMLLGERVRHFLRRG